MSLSINPQVQESIDLGYRPRAWQEEVHRRRTRFNVLALHRRAGKTELAIMELITEAIQDRRDMPFYVYLAPYLKQAVSIAWGRLKARLAPLIERGQVEVREVDKALHFKHNGALIRLFGGDNPDAMRGLRIDGAVIDEVAQLRPEVWHEIVQPAMSDRRGWAMFIGTPNGINLFSELYYFGQRQDDWYTARWTVYDTDSLDAAEVERLREAMPENAFAREYLCDFAAQADNALISLHQVIDAINSPLMPQDVEGSPVILGVDVARYGDDESVIIMRKGLIAYQPKSYQGISNMELAAIVAAIIEEYRPDLVCIDAGRGEGVIDRLRQLGHVVMEVNFGGKPTDPHYVNKRAEMWDTMRQWLDQGGKLPDHERLKQDLCTPLYTYANAANRFALESKDDIRKRGLPSPDYGDALALTFAYPAIPHPLHDRNTGATIPVTDRRRRRRTSDWDPLAAV